MESILSFSISNLTRVPRTHGKIWRSFFAKSFRSDEEKRAGAHRPPVLSSSASFLLAFCASPLCLGRVFAAGQARFSDRSRRNDARRVRDNDNQRA